MKPMTVTPRYAELQVTTNFSFLWGASHAEELIARAKELGLAAIAVTDRNTLAGVVRAHVAAKGSETEKPLCLLIGARLDLEDAPSLLVYPRDRAAYGRLCRLLSLGQGRADKGKCILRLADVAPHAEGQIFIALPPADWDWHEALRSPKAKNAQILRFPSPRVRGEGQGEGQHEHEREGQQQALSKRPPLTPTLSPFEAQANGEREPLERSLRRMKAALGEAPLYLAASHTCHGDDRARISALAELGKRCGTPIVATNDVLYHVPTRRPLQDVLTCIREKTTLAEAGLKLEANAERHLKSPHEMARLFKGFEAALERTLDIVEACTFSLGELVYEYPDEPVPAGKTPQQHLTDLTWEGTKLRFPDGVPDKVRDTILKELALIAERQFAPYFLTVHDIVAYAKSQDILCQGRGSAANSVVCYCLGVTAVNPVEVDLLFERFISSARQEPPDIDVDFEHERREEVIQWIYERYGRDRAGLAATVISYRSRSAVRDVGKAFGLSEDTISALAGMVWGTHAGSVPPERHVRGAGLDPADPTLAAVMERAQELMGFPRHLSQHVGGFVLTRGPLTEVVPVGNAAMEDRTFIEWDKDDIAALGLLKVDVLALGMLTCIRKAFALIEKHHGESYTLATVPRDDEPTYDMLCRAESLGVFQVESRAQMNMLPRLKPRNLYDLVIEVAIVRPGPIQGDMVHPYLRRRSGAEKIVYPSPAHGDKDELRKILGKTLGVPLFQEQAMRIAMVAAEFDDKEVSDLRRAMATFRRVGTIGLLEDKMISKMVARGYDRDFATRCFSQIKGFGEYGFPESHAASFALLVYVSAWIKCHYPAAFACALLNAQPMGFYAPAQIVRDAEKNGVEVRPVDVTFSDWDSTLEDIAQQAASLPSPLEGEVARSAGGGATAALRLGFRQIDGFKEDEAKTVVAALSPGLGEQAQWQINEPACFGSTRQKKNVSSGNTCAESSSAAAVSVGSTLSDPMSSTSFASNGNSSSKSMAASTERKTARGATRPERHGSAPAAIGSSACGTETCASISTAPLKQSSDSSSKTNPELIAEPVTPTPALPLQGGGREIGEALPLGGGREVKEALQFERGREVGEAPPFGGRKEVKEPPFFGEKSGRSKKAVSLPSPLEGEVARSAGGGWRLPFGEYRDAPQGSSADEVRKDFPPPVKGRWRAGEGGALLELAARGRISVSTLEKLAAADAFRSLGLDRRQALWEVKALAPAPPLPLFSWAEARETGDEAPVRLPQMPLSEHVVNDYQTLRLSLKAHPMSFLRDDFRKAGVLACDDLRRTKDGMRVQVAGVVLVRQRPGSGKGVVFMTIEDETGIANAVVWPKMLEGFRKVVMTARLILIEGRVQLARQEHQDIIHVVATRLIDRSDWLLRLSEWAAGMKTPLANADEVLHPDPGSAHPGREKDRRFHPRFAHEPKAHHPRNVRVIPKSRDFH